MAGEEIAVSLQKDITPNLGVMMDVITATADDNADYVDMADYGYTTIYMASAVTGANAASTCTIDGTKVVFTGGVAETILVIGV